jgi:C4-dicarboxylate-specific signal transduction histidine kinase
MKIRLIIIILALVAFLTASVGGYVYYYSIRTNTLLEIHKDTDNHIANIAGRINLYLSTYQKMVAVLAGMREIQQALEREQTGTLDKANTALDLFQYNLAVDVCYLIDASGNTIASSNRNRAESFIDKNYAFRPYFQEAMKGKSTVYMALGVTSGKRGVYHSYPVYLQGQTVPAGVAVIKASVDYIEQEIDKKYDGIIMFADQHGVIFVANRPDWLYHILWKASPDVLNAIASNQQFGKGPLVWTGMERRGTDRAIDPSGREYLIHRAPVLNYPGWEVIYLHDFGIVDRQMSEMILKNMVTIIVMVCIVIGFISIFLYRKASIEIHKRKRMEEKITSISDRLQAVINASPLPISIIDAEGKVLQWNPRGGAGLRVVRVGGHQPAPADHSRGQTGRSPRISQEYLRGQIDENGRDCPFKEGPCSDKCCSFRISLARRAGKCHCCDWDL